MSRWDIALFGHVYMGSRACSVCGKRAKRKYLMHVHCCMEFRELEQVFPEVKRANIRRTGERLSWALCMSCAQRLANKLDSAIDEARKAKLLASRSCMSRTKTTLQKRVAKIFRDVKKLERAGHNKERDYDYTRATDVFEEVRGRMFDAGILLMRDEAPAEYVDRETNGDGLLQECRLVVAYSFDDGTDATKPLRCNGLARDIDDKALYKAQTGADKAFLKRFGLMAEVVDDPEFDGAQEETLDDVAAPRVSRKEKPLRDFEVENIRQAMLVSGKTEAELSEICAGKFHAADVASVKQKDFKALFKWASDGQGTLSPKLQAVPDQGKLPLRTAPGPIEMKIGNKSITFEPTRKASYSQ